MKIAEQIELSTLESHLWGAANILRGPVDAADFKTYVFPLLFFKRISDVYDEEYAVALEKSGGNEEYAQFPQNYRFQIPNGCHWCVFVRSRAMSAQRSKRQCGKPHRLAALVLEDFTLRDRDRAIASGQAIICPALTQNAGYPPSLRQTN